MQFYTELIERYIDKVHWYEWVEMKKMFLHAMAISLYASVAFQIFTFLWWHKRNMHKMKKFGVAI